MAKIETIFERVTETDLKVFDFRCPYPDGCGEPGNAEKPFISAGWAERKHAVERGRQHIAEHETGKPMPELAEFWAEQGLTQGTAGQASLPPDFKL